MSSADQLSGVFVVRLCLGSLLVPVMACGNVDSSRSVRDVQAGVEIVL
jgi:hypothetical protein